MGMDNHNTACVCNDQCHFIGGITPISLKLKEINRSLKIIGTETVRWIITDDTGKIHTITIKKCTIRTGCTNVHDITTALGSRSKRSLPHGGRYERCYPK